MPTVASHPAAVQVAGRIVSRAPVAATTQVSAPVGRAIAVLGGAVPAPGLRF